MQGFTQSAAHIIDPDIQLNPLNKKIPLLNQIKYLANLIEEAGEIKLTKLGFLPTDLVADIYAQGFIKDRYVERRRVKQLKEGDVPSITLSKILLTISGLVKKRSNKLSLTKQGQKFIQNDNDLVQLIMKTYGENFIGLILMVGNMGSGR